MKKHLGLIATLILAFFGVAIGYGKLQGKTEETAKRVEWVEDDLEKVDEKTVFNKDDIKENESVNREQFIMIENINKQQERIVDAVTELVKEVKK